MTRGRRGLGPIDPAGREAESRAALDRVARDTQSIGGSPLARLGQRMGDHFGGQDAVGQAEGGGTDPVEVWGRRIGRAISVAVAAGLTWWLGAQLGWW